MRLVNHRSRLWLLFVVIAVVVAGGAYAAAPGSTAATAHPRVHNQTIELREASDTPNLKVVDIGAPGLSTGDHVVTTDGLVRPDGTSAGSFTTVCTVVQPGANLFVSAYDCSGSFQLAQGQLTVQGSFVPTDPESSFAITGGTGVFAAASGEAILATEADEITIALD